MPNDKNRRITTAHNYSKMIKSRLSWKKKRFKHMAGIKAFHKSTKGKRMHRNLARTLATRTAITRDDTRLRLRPDRDTAREMLKTVSSYKTHILIEEDWATRKELTEALDQSLFEGYALPIIHAIEGAIMADVENFDLNEEQLELLFRLCAQKDLSNAFEQAGSPLPETFDNYYDSFAITEAVAITLKGESIGKP